MANFRSTVATKHTFDRADSDGALASPLTGMDNETGDMRQASGGSPLLRLFAPRGQHARLSVLCFHRIHRTPDPFYPEEPTVERFEARMKWIKSRFTVLAMGEAMRLMALGRLPDRALSITFDDGYADNHDLVLPVLSRLGLPATFYITTGCLDGGILFNDVIVESLRQAKTDVVDLSRHRLGRYEIRTPEQKRAAFRAIDDSVKAWRIERRDAFLAEFVEQLGATLPTDRMMSSEQVAALVRGGMEVGGHTVSHPILASLAYREALYEITGCKARLEEIVGQRVELFAYPNGLPGRDYRREHVDMLREAGYSAAVSTAWGASGNHADRFQVRRFTPQTDEDWRYELRLIRNLWARGNPLV